MTRNELKQLWFSIPTDENKIETKYGHVSITKDGPSGYSSFKTNQGENALKYALDTKEYKSKEYKLVIK